MSRIQNFLQMYQSRSTRDAYKWALTSFFETLYGEDGEHIEEHAETYFKEQRIFEEDIQNFLKHIRDKPPKSVNLMLAAVRIFLVENDVELSDKFWKRLRGRVKGSRALTLDKVPSNVEFRKILTHLPIQGKALYLVLESSGMRIGEALQLKMEDLELDQDPVNIYIKGEYTKTGNSRMAFVSVEAKESLQEWLKVRSEYLSAASGKSHFYGKSVKDPRVFPFRDATAYAMWRSALKKTRNGQRDKSTQRYRVHPHVLRKFFRTRLGAVIPVDVVEALMGHEGYLTEVYRRYTVEDLAKFYKQGEHALLVFTEAAEVGKLRKDIQEQRDVLQRIVNGLTAENLELKSRMSRMELEHTDLKKENQEQTQKLENLLNAIDPIIKKMKESK